MLDDPLTLRRFRLSEGAVWLSTRWEHSAHATVTMYPMTRHNSVLLHREAIHDVASCHKAHSISLVGSVARGKDTSSSDCDFVAEFLPDASLFDHIELEIAMEELLDSPVDVISAAAARRRFPRMLQESIRL